MKIAGLICIVLSCSMVGMLVANEKKKKIRYVEGILYLVRHIKYKITYFRSELNKIYEDFSNRFLNDTGFYNELKISDLHTVLNKYNQVYSIREYESNALNYLALTLGRSSWEDQTDKCTIVIEMLEKYLDELNTKYPEERKFIASLGIISGLLIAVVLV